MNNFRNTGVMTVAVWLLFSGSTFAESAALVGDEAAAKFSQLVNAGASVITEIPLIDDDALIELARTSYEARVRNEKVIRLTIENLVAETEHWKCVALRKLYIGPTDRVIRECKWQAAACQEAIRSGFDFERNLLDTPWNWQLQATVTKRAYVCMRNTD